MDEAGILQLKDKRSRAKATLTAICNKITRRKNISFSNLQTIHNQLETAYDHFIELHHEYATAVSDEEFSAHRIVSGLSLDEYLTQSEELYNDTISSYATLAFKHFSLNATVAIRKAELMLDSNDNSVDFCNQISNHIPIMQELCHRLDTYPTDDTAPIVSKLEELILHLECKQVGSASNTGKSLHVRFDRATSQPTISLSSDSTQHSNNHSDSNASTSQSIDSTPLSVDNTIRNSVPPSHESTRLHNNSDGEGFLDKRVQPKSSTGLTKPFDTQLAPQDLSIVALYRDTNKLTHTPIETDTTTDSAQHTRFKFSKSPLPTFSGDRKAYGEFRSIWRMIAAREFSCDQERAWELKHCLKDQAHECIEAINTTHIGAYELMWKRLDSKYCNIGLSVKDVYSKLSSLSPVKEEDMVGIVKFVNQVELCYSQLGEIGHIDSITICQIDELCNLLPAAFKWQWMEKIQTTTIEEQLHPFSSFMGFLEGKRETAARLAESSSTVTPTSCKSKKSNASSNAVQVEDSNKVSTCFIHPEGKHAIDDCRKFCKMSNDEKYGVLKEHHACYRCLRKHARNKCKGGKCKECKKNNHHTLLCRGKPQDNTSQNVSNTASQPITSSHCYNGSSLLPIQDISLFGSERKITVFFDGGSNASLITHQAARQIHAKRVKSIKLDLTTTGNVITQYETYIYKVILRSTSNTPITILAYGLTEITGKVSRVDTDLLCQLFPRTKVNHLERGEYVDLLLGSDYTGLHPRKEVARAGKNLWILEGPLGQCIQGSHQELGSTGLVTSQFASIHVSVVARDYSPCNHVEFTSPTAHYSKAKEAEIGLFVKGENLGTELSIKCGGCKCSRCPVPGHSYSFVEEQELEMIRRNLQYDDENHCWTTTYPWITDPSKLPDNYNSAFATLQSTERALRKDPQWAEVYSRQIQDMVERQVARKLTSDEIAAWQGPYFYISHLAVQNPKSTSTPVRIVFNSSQVTQGMSLNSCLAKGPDAYINNLLGVILRWREGRVALVADIRKMYNSIHIGNIEQHCHRFLWRNLENREPDTYIITRVNMGDRPAAAISAEAINKTADKVESEHSDVSQLLRQSTYVDDLVHSTSTKQEALKLAKSTTEVLKSVGFVIKHWLFSGECGPRDTLDAGIDPLGDPSYRTQVLGIYWEPFSDQIVTETKLNFSSKKKGVYTMPDLLVEQIPAGIPNILTRRSVLEQTMKLYDPLGFYCAFTLKAKCLLRETWTSELSWDTPLPEELAQRWVVYFTELFELSHLRYDRSLTPVNAVGDPILIIFSDASDIAYGFAAYIRWQLDDGKYWCCLIMAKSRIAPLRKLSTPQMELCGAVLSKRGRKVIETECQFKFAKVYQLVDSETILCSINKTSTRFKLFEGVRIAEIQSATKGNLDDWFWVKGTDNTADWLTRGKNPVDIGPNSEWWKGPAFLYEEEDSWNIKSHAQCIDVSCSITATEKEADSSNFLNFNRFKSAHQLLWTYARIYSALMQKSFKGGHTQKITPDIIKCTKHLLIKAIQRLVIDDIKDKKGKYSKLSLFQDSNGIWCVGKRLAQNNPMIITSQHHPQVLLPTDNYFTRLLMQQSHKESGHRGRDATLARFRFEYWTTQGSKLARRIVDSCQLCRVREPKLLAQGMGTVPLERVTPGPPFNHTMIDLFGPYIVRGEVQKRTSGKVYGILFTDLASRAVHIEPAFAYDSESFLLALQRFTNIRGWPEVIFSDPGSQLIGAEKELVIMWKEMQKDTIYKISTDNGTEWRFSPADSPWRQGAAESLIKAAKRAIKLAIHDHRVSPTEFLTLCTEIASILNERPLGTLPSIDSTINILTPNVQLIGRPFKSNPGGWNSVSSVKSRIKLVNSIADEFWSKWTEQYAPSLIRQGKWKTISRNLKPGDIVSVADSNALRGKYYIAQVQEVFPGRDGCVRKVSVRYKNFRVGEQVHEYKGSKDVVVYRSIQKLALLVPIDETQ